MLYLIFKRKYMINNYIDYYILYIDYKVDFSQCAGLRVMWILPPKQYSALKNDLNVIIFILGIKMYATFSFERRC